MRVAAILGLGSSTRDLRPFQSDRIEWAIGLPASSAGVDAILVFGGDGTVHRHLAALVELALPVLVIPAGSGNDFARALGLFRERDSLEAWAAFVSDRRNLRAVDLGIITQIGNDPASAPDSAQKTNAEGHGQRFLHRPADLATPTYFSCAAGVGLDGEIARRANRLPRWLRAHGGYALSLPGALFRFRPFVLHLSTAGSDQETEFRLRSSQPVTAAVFANTAVYGGGMKIAPRAQMDDGQLDICVIRDISKLKLLSVFPSVYFGRHLGLHEVDYFSSAAARIETVPSLDVYADGEYVCRTPVAIGVAKSALRVIVPDRANPHWDAANIAATV